MSVCPIPRVTENAGNTIGATLAVVWIRSHPQQQVHRTLSERWLIEIDSAHENQVSQSHIVTLRRIKRRLDRLHRIGLIGKNELLDRQPGRNNSLMSSRQRPLLAVLVHLVAPVVVFGHSAQRTPAIPLGMVDDGVETAIVGLIGVEESEFRLHDPETGMGELKVTYLECG